MATTITTSLIQTAEALSEQDTRISSIILFILNKVFPPAVIVGGLIGNLLIYLVLKQPQYAKQTTCFFMRTLAICDSCSLGHIIIRTMVFYHPGYMLFKSGKYVCPIMAFFTGVYGLSNWTTTAMTFDRFLAVRYPLKVASWCTMKRCRICLVCIYISGIAILIPYSFRSVKPGAMVLKEICRFDPNIFPLWFHGTIHLIQSFGLFTTPFCLILIFNMSIIATLIQEKIRKRGSMMATSGGKPKDSHITVLLLLVTSVFFVTNIPWTLDQLIWNPNQVLSPRMAMIRQVTYEVEVLLLVLNPSVNFYTYCLGCRKFRNDVKAMFSKVVK
ncbi:galanin receptor 2b-like [Lineus longissimus]|uniref:galanin receptor 2b-like n=1 Tax=Lineus longissimus TaxID=88925 RepID=UPI00315D3ED9